MNHNQSIQKVIFNYNMKKLPDVIYTASGNQENTYVYKIQKGIKGLIPTKIKCNTHSESEECARELNKRIGINAITYNAMVYCCLFGFDTYFKSLNFYNELEKDIQNIK